MPGWSCNSPSLFVWNSLRLCALPRSSVVQALCAPCADYHVLRMPRPMTTATTDKKRAGRPAPELTFGDLWEFDPAPETADPKLKARYDLFIDGRFVAAKSGGTFESVNPATEKPLAEIALAGAEDVDAAYRAAAKALPAWSKRSGAERGKFIYRLARLLQDRAREFAVA